MGATEADAVIGEIVMTPVGRENPYPLYQRLREMAPVHDSEFLGPLFLSRYSDCRAALTSPSLGKFEAGMPRPRGVMFQEVPEAREMIAATQQAQAQGASMMLFANPPDHTRLRGLVSKAFTPKRVEALRPRVAAIVEDMISTVREKGECDLMAELAYPLPITVIGELLGVPQEDRLQFQPLVRVATTALEPAANMETMEKAASANMEMAEYFTALLAEKAKSPQDDLLSAMLLAQEGDDRLTDVEILATSILLFAAGFETTANLIGNGAYALIEHPEQIQLMADGGENLKRGVDELLRWDSPIQMDVRVALEDFKLADATLSRGDMVVMFLGAANHDPEEFSEPGRFDVTRKESQPMSFGAGIHYCLGAALAKLEGQEVFGAISREIPGIKLASTPPERRQGITFRGFTTLPVTTK